MHCGNCGTKIVNKNAVYCGQCGNYISYTKGDNIQYYYDDVSQKPNYKKTNFTAIIAVVFLVLIVVAGIYWIKKQTNIDAGSRDKSTYGNVETTTVKKTEVAKPSSIDVPALETQELSIQKMEQNVKSIEPAEILAYNGTMSAAKQVDTYEFVAPRDGLYRFGMMGMQANVRVHLQIYNALGEKISSNDYCNNNEGRTINGLQAGNVYNIKIVQYDGLSNYTMKIGQQKEKVDVSNYTAINDSVEFTDQRNVYSFTVPRDGTYRFWLSEMYSGVRVHFSIFNVLGEQVGRSNYSVNNSGITLYNLRAGDIYTLQIAQYDYSGNYKLNIGYQKEFVDISNYSVVNDSIEYKNQRNVYYFTPVVNGLYRFEIAEMISGNRVDIYAFNYLGETLASRQYAENGTGITVNLAAGETYQIQVCQNDGAANYKLKIGKQKELVEVSEKINVTDSIQYTDQQNVYLFKPKATKSYTYVLSEIPSSCAVSISIENELGEVLGSINKAQNGNSITLNNAEEGKTYKIRVKYCTGYGSYKFKIE